MRNAGKLRKDRRRPSLDVNGMLAKDGEPVSAPIFRPPTDLSPLCPKCSSKVFRSLLQERFSCSVCGWLEAIQ